MTGSLVGYTKAFHSIFTDVDFDDSHPAVTAVIPGTTKLAHLEDNQRAGRGRLPDAALRKRIEEYWDALG